MPTTITLPPPPVPPSNHRLVTGEELSRHPEWGPCELIRGKVVPVCRPKSQHGYLMIELAAEMRNFVKKHRLGTVIGGDAGVYLENNPDTVRGPDVYYISAKKMPMRGIPSTFQKTPPDICAEILSPSDKLSEVNEKVAQFLAIGVPLIWVLNPKTRSAQVHRSNGTVSEIPSNGFLSGEDILPGFELPLTELFSAID